MTKYLLDTNICVFIMRGKHNLVKKLESIGIENCCISEITLVELLYGAECSDRPGNIHQVIKEFCNRVEVVPISNTLHDFARQKAILRRRGALIDDFDLLIACCAIANNLIMVTDNIKHFDRLSGITIQNWIER